MRGFDTKALILYPFLENVKSRGSAYVYSMRKATDNLCDYLNEMGIAPHVFYSDDVARLMNNPQFVWVSTLSRADSFFASRYCDGMQEALTRPTERYEDIYNQITAKDPGSQDMSTEERFEMVLRHCNKAAAAIIPTYKIVIHFRYKNKMQYKVTSKAGDSKIRIFVDAGNFLPTAYMGGMEMNIIDMLNVPYANRALDVWGT